MPRWDAEVANQVVCLPGFHDYVIYVRLDSPADMVSENVLHAPLVRCTRVPEAERYRDVT
jgi:hypothetical protein